MNENSPAHAAGHAKGMPMASTKYQPYPTIDLTDRTWPSKRITKAADLVLGRSARRQPGADRSDGTRPQGAHVPAPARHGLQGNRDRLSVGLADRFRLCPLVRGGRQRARRRVAAGAGPVPAGADHAHLRGARGRTPADRPFLQFHQRVAAPRRVRQGRRRRQADRHRRGQDDHRHGGQGAAADYRLRIFAGKLHRHRARSGAGDLQRGHRDREADAGQQADPQPAGDRRDVDAQHLCRRDRMDVPQPRQSRD